MKEYRTNSESGFKAGIETRNQIQEDLKDRALEVCRTACQNAYAPYSHFPVGAALLLQDGQIIPGCNVENASYGMTICAERTAMAAAVAAGYTPDDMLGIAIYAPAETLISPCGACRQVMMELLGPDGTVFLVSDQECREYRVRDLLPLAFSL